MLRVVGKLKTLWTGLFFQPNEAKYFHYLQKKPVKKQDDSKTVVLIEFSRIYSNIIGLYYFLLELRAKTNASFVAYMLYPLKPWTSLLLFKFKKIYQALGVSKFILVHPQNGMADEIDTYLKLHPIHINTTKDLEMLEFEGVWIGDIVYDSYLYKTRKPTVDVKSTELQMEIREALYYYLFWKKYFSENKVQSLVVSHTVYTHFAVASRLAIALNIEVFQVNDAGLYRLSTEKKYAYHEFFDFKKALGQIPKDLQLLGREWAKQRLQRRFGGEVGVDMSYSPVSAWVGSSACAEIVPSSRKKILVATHCFFDSPHPYGLNLFTDFYEWLTFLGKISERTDYDWYLKSHPGFLPGNDTVLSELSRRFPKLKVISATTSHPSLLSSGIDLVLTVYGTIGMEYAYHGVPVINASPNNVHIAFDFNLHPKSIGEYEALLLSLEKLSLNIPKEQILDYYFLKNFVFHQSWIWSSLEEMTVGIGGDNMLSTNEILNYFFKVYSPELEAKALKNAKEFLDSEAYCPMKSPEELRELLHQPKTG